MYTVRSNILNVMSNSRPRSEPFAIAIHSQVAKEDRNRLTRLEIGYVRG